MTDTVTEPQGTGPEPADPIEPATKNRSLRRDLPKWSLWAALALLVWLAIAVFGPKIGIIDWRTGFLFMTVTAGPILMGIVALFALIALLYAFFRTPRGPWWKAAIALAIPVFLFMGLLSVRAQGEAVPPIHDVATDLRNPPEFSAGTLAAREEFGANPINNYGTPLGQMEMWRDADTAIASKNHADLISENYPELRPIVIGGATQQEALDAIVAAMGEIGLTDIHTDTEAGTVEGVAETFAFGFKDDVVARVADGQIDLRSVSRVGVSDLGYNAARLENLIDAIEDRLGR